MSFGSCLWMRAAKWNRKSTKSHTLKRIKWVSYECDSWSSAIFVFCSSFVSGSNPLPRPFYFYPTSNSQHQIRVFFHLIVLTFFCPLDLTQKTRHTHTHRVLIRFSVYGCALIVSINQSFWRRINQMVFGTSHIDIAMDTERERQTKTADQVKSRQCARAMYSGNAAAADREHVKLNELKSLAVATAAVALLCCTRCLRVCLCVAVIALHMLWMEFLFHFSKSNIISRRDRAKADGFDAHGRTTAMAKRESDKQDIKPNVRRTCTVCESK